MACLRDLKKWLRLFDDKNNRMDVARCIAEHNLLGGDLLQILALWPENETNNKIKSRIALACVELLTPLTWYLPKEADVEDDQKKHIPYLTMAQVEYKRQIINFDGARILHTVTRTALPSIAVPLKERSNRDNNIIRMLLYFIRNITMIEPPKGRETEGDEAEISRSALIDAYQYQDVLYLLLALCSGDFGHQDVVILEVLFHLIKGIDIDTLFMNEKEKTVHQFDALAELRSKEAGMHRSYQRTAPSRHGRFGTMIQVSRGDGKVSTLSGQDALLDSSKVLAKMDGVKKPKPNMKRSKRDLGVMDFDKRVRLAPRAQKSMKEFVCDFLDSGFNPLFQSIKKAIQQDAERVDVYHTTMFFYLVSWFLQAERARRASQRQQKGNNTPPEDSFGLIAAVLDQPMFILINREMEILASDGCPLHHELKAAMRCFTQVLLTVQDMYDSPLEEDQEIAENILQRIFHEETTHDRVVKIVATYHTNEGDKDFGFLDTCTELSHVFLRLLENYSKVNKDIFIRSKQRTRRKTKAKAAANGNEGLDLGNEEDEEVDDRQYAVASRDRKLDFKKFAAKFVTQNCVNTFVKLLQYYNELKLEQLKRCHRYFHRVAFKMDFSVMLFRLDIIALLNKMIKGPGGLDPASKAFKEWNDLIVHVFRLMTKKLKERPELFVEILFSKTTPVANFIMHGHETVVVATQKPVRAWEVKKSVPEEKWIATVVSAMLDHFEAHLLEWYKSELVRIETERRSWEEANKALESIEGTATTDEAPPAPPVEDDADAIPPSAEQPTAPSVVLSPFSTTIKNAILKNPRLRLLFTLCGLTQIGDEEEIEGTLWIVPSSVSADKIRENLAVLRKAEFDPLTGENYTDGKGAEDQLKPVSTATTHRSRRADFDDGDDESEDDWDDALFPAGGPTNIHKKDALALLRKKNRTSIRVGEEKVLTAEQEESRRLLKEKKDREKQRRIKSSLFVHDTDDDSDGDREFFAKEEALRKAKETGSFVAKMGEKAEKKRARKKVNNDNEDEDMSDASSDPSSKSAESTPEPELLPQPKKKPPRKRTPKRKIVEPQTDDEDDLDVQSVASSPAPRRISTKRAKLSESPAACPAPEAEKENIAEKGMGTGNEKADVAMVELDDSDGELAAPRTSIRKRVMGGFLLDSSDEE